LFGAVFGNDALGTPTDNPTQETEQAHGPQRPGQDELDAIPAGQPAEYGDGKGEQTENCHRTSNHYQTLCRMDSASGGLYMNNWATRRKKPTSRAGVSTFRA
jgi:hypothetical protein